MRSKAMKLPWVALLVISAFTLGSPKGEWLFYS